MRWRSRFALVATLMMATACASTPTDIVPQRYVCADGEAFFARYQPDQVMLDFGGGVSKTLAAQPAIPGAYGGQANLFRVHGATATLVRSGAATTCRRGEVRDLVLFW